MHHCVFLSSHSFCASLSVSVYSSRASIAPESRKSDVFHKPDFQVPYPTCVTAKTMLSQSINIRKYPIACGFEVQPLPLATAASPPRVLMMWHTMTWPVSCMQSRERRVVAMLSRYPKTLLRCQRKEVNNEQTMQAMATVIRTLRTKSTLRFLAVCERE